MQCFYTKLPFQKPTIRQKERWVQNRSITNKDILSVTNLCFWKFCYSIRTSYKELIWCTSYINIHIHTFCKRWSLIWGCFFPVSILKLWIHSILNLLPLLCRGGGSESITSSTGVSKLISSKGIRGMFLINIRHRLPVWPVWLNGLAFFYELSGCGFESRCSHLYVIEFINAKVGFKMS